MGAHNEKIVSDFISKWDGSLPVITPPSNINVSGMYIKLAEQQSEAHFKYIMAQNTAQFFALMCIFTGLYLIYKFVSKMEKG